MPVRRDQDAYGGRFASDPTGGSVLAGYQQATNKLDRDLVKRNIKPYERYGFEQSLNELAGMTDQARYKMATKAVLAKNEVGVKKKDTPKRKTKPRSSAKPKAPPKTRKPKAAPKAKSPTRKQQARKAGAVARKAVERARKQVPLKPPRTAPRLPPRAKPTPKPPPLFGRPPVRV